MTRWFLNYNQSMHTNQLTFMASNQYNITIINDDKSKNPKKTSSSTQQTTDQPVSIGENSRMNNNNQQNSNKFDVKDSDLASSLSRTVNSNPSMGQYECGSIINDTLLLRHRRTGLNKHGFKRFEFMAEEKVAKNKLDQIHWSEPSSMKSTFMMAFSPSGQRVASTHGDHRIYICDLNTGQHLDTLEGHPKTPWCFAWHPTNRDILASGCLAGEVRVWNLRSKSCQLWTSDTIITSISFHPIDRIIAIATANAIHFWDWTETVPFAITTTPYEKERVKYVEFDSSGTKLITGIANWTTITAYSGDSLQNRIIDNYLHNNNNNNNINNNNINHNHNTSNDQNLSVEQNRTENMTQTSEIPHNLSSSQMADEILNANTSSQNRYMSARQQVRLTSGSLNEPTNHFTSTITTNLSRIACLYTNLESLEDSIRNTSFAPYNPVPATPSTTTDTISTSTTANKSNETEANDNNEQIDKKSNKQNQLGNQEKNDKKSNNEMTLDTGRNIETNSTITSSSPSNASSSQLIRAPNTCEPLVVSFDELLESIQLIPIIVNGRRIDLTSLLARNPIDLTNHLDIVLQFESINQVNQNFIRISKLMSSVRLYRQITQQIMSSNSYQGHYQPNQILTVQSVMSGSNRNAQFPTLLRYPALQTSLNTNLDGVGNDGRPLDQIMVIQYRSCARNVPLGSVCKVDLLFARTMCMVRSQQYLETIFSPDGGQYQTQDMNLALLNILDGQGSNDSLIFDNNSTTSSATTTTSGDNSETMIIQPFSSMLYNLQKSLSMINQPPLNTSNVHTQIASLRNILSKILDRFSSMINIKEEARRLVNLVHEISQNLTGRLWTSPLGHTYDELRLDVVHTLCMVDLTLHLSRQLQLLQMQRISAIARIRHRTIETTQQSSTSTHSTQSNTNPSTHNIDSSESGNNTLLDHSLIYDINQLSQNQPSTSNTLDVRASCSTSNQQQSNSLSQSNIDSEGGSSIMNISDNKFIDNDAGPTSNPPGKRRNNDTTSESHLSLKKSKLESDSSTSMIDSAPTNNPVTDGLVINSDGGDSNNKPTTETAIPNSIVENNAITTVKNNNNNEPNNSIIEREHQNHQLLGQPSSNILQAPNQFSQLNDNISTLIDRIDESNQDRSTLSSATNQVISPPPPGYNIPRVYLSAAPQNLQVLMRIIQRVHGTNHTNNNNPNNNNHNNNVITADNHLAGNPPIESRRRALSHDYAMLTDQRHNLLQSTNDQNNLSTTQQQINVEANNFNTRPRLVTASQSNLTGLGSTGSTMDNWPRHQFQIFIPHHSRGPNVLWMALPTASSNFRLQCWNFEPARIPNIKDALSNVITNRCRIDTNASIDISRDGDLIACLVPQDDHSQTVVSRYELRVISLRPKDFGVCLHAVSQGIQGPQAISVSLSPTARYAVVGLSNGRHSLFGHNNPDDPEGLTIAKVFELDNEKRSIGHLRDIKIKRQGPLNLNSIKWMTRGIVYNVGQHPMLQHRYQARRFNYM